MNGGWQMNREYKVGDWVIWMTQFDYLAKLNPFQIIQINDNETVELDAIYHSVPINQLGEILCTK